jgi:hypothetical protein
MHTSDFCVPTPTDRARLRSQRSCRRVLSSALQVTETGIRNPFNLLIRRTGKAKPQHTTMILSSRFRFLGLLCLSFFSQTSHATVILNQRAAASTSVVLDGVTYVNKVRF